MLSEVFEENGTPVYLVNVDDKVFIIEYRLLRLCNIKAE